MYTRNIGSRRGAAIVGVLAAIGVAPVLLAAERGSWRIERGEVKVTVPLKPGGAFEAKTTSLAGSLTAGSAKPLALTGELTVDLSTIDTGIALRNQHLREKYLELAKGSGYDKAVLTNIKVETAGDDAFQGQSAFTGTLVLHGIAKEISGTAEFRRAGAGVRVEASFPLTLPDHRIEPPEYLGVGVASRLLVRVSFTAQLAPGAGQ